MTDAVRLFDYELEHVDCPVCGPSPNTRWMDDGKPTRYLRCRSCGTIYASPRVARAARFAWLDQSYQPGVSAVANEASRLAALRHEAAIIGRYLNGGRLLDVGCDLGAFFEGFAEPAWQRYGVELSRGAAEFAARRYNAQVFAGTIHEAAYPEGHFDLVTMIDMFCHVDDPIADLRETARVLKPGGFVALEAPGLAWIAWRSRGLLCWLIDRRWTRLHSDSTYLHFLSPTGFGRLFERAGFQLVGAHVIGSPASTSRWRNLATETHRRLMAGVVRFAPPALTWAPKYLLIGVRA
jgi:SAM-dependent methyltransferase